MGTLVNALDDLPVVKYLSDTRWAAHSDASKAFNCGYEKIRIVLEQFTENLDETDKARQEARGILSKFPPPPPLKLHLTGVLVCCHGKVSPDKHKATERNGSERSHEALKVIK